MIYVLQDAVHYVTAIVASVSQNVYQDAANAIALHAFAFQVIAVILAAVFVFAVLANVILEEDASHLAIMCATMTAKYTKTLLYNIIFLDNYELTGLINIY